jgi:rfaE bifunctional protein nucleotidyltransferase chain/domain
MVRSISYYEKRIKVFTNGCFDLFHAGHLKILKEAKKLGTELHVGINSNFSVAILKGLNRPIISEEYRLEIVKAIKYVDRVYLFDEPTPIKLIEEIKPDIIVKGGDYNKEDVVGSNLAEVIIVPLMKNVSTSNIINRIINENV